MKIEAEVQTDANKKVAKSISDELIDYQKIEKWNGKLPTVTGGNAIVNLDNNTADSDTSNADEK